MDIRITERNLNGRKRWIVTNGFKKRGVGYRACVVDNYGNVNQVNHVDRRGAEWARATHQIANHGDYVLCRQTGDEFISVFSLMDGTLIKTTEVERRNVLHHTSLELEEWLECDDREESSILPAGYGWDGERTGSEISKFDRVEGFFKRNHVPKTIRDRLKYHILNTRGNMMDTSWMNSGPLPNVLTCGHIWVLWVTYNRPVVLEFVGDDRPLPPRLTKAMRILIDHESQEVSWNLYSNINKARR